jgi:hypothetical protein
MIEPSRRHGHFDPRFSIQRAGVGRPAANGPAGTDALPVGLDWGAFSGRLFPGRRRHDFEMLKAYEASKSGSPRPAEQPARVREAAPVLVGAV